MAYLLIRGEINPHQQTDAEPPNISGEGNKSISEWQKVKKKKKVAIRELVTLCPEMPGVSMGPFPLIGISDNNLSALRPNFTLSML